MDELEKCMAGENYVHLVKNLPDVPDMIDTRILLRETRYQRMRVPV